jgi:hypothetical protein
MTEEDVRFWLEPFPGQIRKEDIMTHDEKIIKATRNAKHRVIIERFDDDTFNAEFEGLTARQQLLPMLRHCERIFRLRLARHEFV